MASKSPSLSIKSREIIGSDVFSQRKEIFGQHETVFFPTTTVISPTTEVQQINTTNNEGNSISNFRRTTAYSSMRENRKEDIRSALGFRERKLSDNFTSELNQSDGVDYRHSMTERTRRLSKLRRDFLASNLHEPSNGDLFSRTGTRQSLPATRVTSYKIESPTIYKFPFAEPYSTPPPVRKVYSELGPVDAAKENQDPTERKHESAPASAKSTKDIDHRKLFEELVNRYSPTRKHVDWTIPPTKPRVVGSLPKLNRLQSSEEGKDVTDQPKEEEENKIEETNVEDSSKQIVDGILQETAPSNEIVEANGDINQNIDPKPEESHDSKLSLTELNEKNDRVPELLKIQRQISKESTKRIKVIDDNIPALLEKMEGEPSKTEDKKKIKRKRSFMDKLFNRKKEDK